MNLLIDIGNTRIKWALQGSEVWQPGHPILRQNKAFKDLARPTWKELDVPGRVIISCVAGTDYTKSVRTWIKRRWKIDPEFLQPQATQFGVTNAYKEPERLGADRWASLLAAHDAYRQPVVVVDCGTAITVDAIDADGRHLGGLISPGFELMTESLASNAPGIEIIDTHNTDIPLLGGSTEVGVTGGVLYTVVAFVDRVFADLKTELGKTTKLLITGGDAERIQPLLSTQPVLDSDLVLKGLGVFARNTGVTTESTVAPADEVEQGIDVEAAVCDS